MKKGLLLVSSLALLALAGCNKESNVVPDPSASGELAVLPMNGGGASRMTKGYVEESKFVETTYESLHGDKNQKLRTMQISAYLTPQNGEAKNYFVDKTYSSKTTNPSETIWWNTNIVGGDHDPIYWPVGGTLDFLAYSLSAEESGAGKSQNIKAVWDNTNAAQKVTLTVPGENTQNDILFASAYGEKSRNTGSPVNMTFNHSQAWLEFILTGSTDGVHTDGIVNVQKIELENVYNAGVLSISNNGGNAIAKWDFTGEDKQNISVDNFNENLKLTGSPKYLDMLIPQQTKTAFVIYYTLGSDTQVLSYRFTTDQKTWLMGEKYIYKINITTSEVTVAPVVTPWSGPVQGFEYTVKTPATIVKSEDGDNTFGTVSVGFLPSADSFKGTPAEDGSATYTCDTWGAQVTLKAEPEGDAVFVKWSDGVTENPRTFTITESVNLPEALFGYEITTKTSDDDASRCTTVTETYIAGESATIEGSPADGYKLYKWYSDDELADELTSDDNITVSDDGKTITIASVNAKQTFYAKYIPVDAIPGAFSVAADKKVFFAKGNLYWGGSKFGIEADQTAFSMTWDPSHVSHFYWSKDKDVAVAENYSDDDAADVDTFFAANGGAIEGYTVLTYYEWSYLLSTSGSGRTDANRFAKAKVNGVNGILIFPDGYTGKVSGAGIGTINNASTEEAFPTENIGVEDWQSMQNAGVVFLPASGYRYDSGVLNVGSYGNYWSSTPNDKGGAYIVFFLDSVVGVGSGTRSGGKSVRLVTD